MSDYVTESKCGSKVSRAWLWMCIPHLTPGTSGYRSVTPTPPGPYDQGLLTHWLSLIFGRLKKNPYIYIYTLGWGDRLTSH